jgi:3-isopropylmalate/(R)-2-methylmalate dehydratase small subunit
MKEKIVGKAYVLGHDVDTDQIIPAQHLVYSLSDPEEKKKYGANALSGVPESQAGLPLGHVRFVEEGAFLSPFKVIIAGKNFGCGSSREHAPVSLNIAGVEAVVAESYARIFYRNSVDGGFFIPYETPDRLVQEIATGDEIEIDVEKSVLTDRTTGKRYPLKPLGDVAEIVNAGGIFSYARKSGMIR